MPCSAVHSARRGEESSCPSAVASCCQHPGSPFGGAVVCRCPQPQRSNGHYSAHFTQLMLFCLMLPRNDCRLAPNDSTSHLMPQKPPAAWAGETSIAVKALKPNNDTTSRPTPPSQRPWRGARGGAGGWPQVPQQGEAVPPQRPQQLQARQALRGDAQHRVQCPARRRRGRPNCAVVATEQGVEKTMGGLMW